MTQMRSSTPATTQGISSAFQDTQPSPNILMQKTMYSHCKKCLNLTLVCEITDTTEQRSIAAQSCKIPLGLEVLIICGS